MTFPDNTDSMTICQVDCYVSLLIAVVEVLQISRETHIGDLPLITIFCILGIEGNICNTDCVKWGYNTALYHVDIIIQITNSNKLHWDVAYHRNMEYF